MKYFNSFFCLSFITILLIFSNNIFGQDKKTLPEENFFNKSLHFTNKGLTYVYAKENGGLEKLTGLTASEMNCATAKCHVKSCDVCHLKMVDGKSFYTVDAAKETDACKNCHSSDQEGPDVHVKKGMKCMDCHSKREIHGDGIEHNSYNEKGFFDTKCENCHTNLTQSLSHTVHNNKLDCSACHTPGMSLCFNCHIDTRIKDKKSAKIPLNNVIFLINKDDKVSIANVLTYVYDNKTMITAGPTYSHSIVKEGRKCEECHNSQIVKDIKENKFTPVYQESGGFKNVEGVIPLYDILKWKMNFYNYENGNWIKIDDPGTPLINYSFCSPLTKEQFDKLQVEHNSK